MAQTIVTYPFTSTKNYQIPFEYLARRFIVVTLVGDLERRVLVAGTDYRFISPTDIETTNQWTTGDGFRYLEIRRSTSASDRLVDFNDGSVLRANDLNVAQTQALHIAEESKQIYDDTVSLNPQGLLDARNRRIVNLQDGLNDSDAATVRQVKAAQSNIRRSIRVSAEEPELPELPPVANRKGLVLGFNDLGVPTMVIPAPSSVEDVMLRLAGEDGSMFVGHGDYSYILPTGTVGAALQHFPLRADVEVKIPADFPDLQAALDWCSTKRGSMGKLIKVIIQSGYVIPRGFRIDDVDLRHVILTSEDPTVGVSPTFTHIETYDLPAGVARGNMFSFVAVRSVMPQWNIVIDHAAAPTDGGYCLYWGRGFVYNHKGVLNAKHDYGNPREGGAGFKIGGASWLAAPYAVADGCDIGFALTQSTVADVQYAKARNARITGIDVSRGSVVYALNSDVSGAIGEGFYVRRSRVIAEAAIIKNCPIGMRVQATAEVSCVNAVFDGCAMAVNRGSASSVEISGATFNGIQLDTRVDLLFPQQINMVDQNGCTYSSNRPVGGVSAITSQYPAAGVGTGQVQCPPRAYATINEITGTPREVFGVTLYGHFFGVRLTIDGVVVLNSVGATHGKDADGTEFCVYNIPAFRSQTSYKIEVYNLHQTVTKQIGFNFQRRI